MMRRLTILPLTLGLLACEPPYREALRAGDQHAATDPTGAASYYEQAVALGAAAQGHLKLAELAERNHAWESAAAHYAEAQKALPKEPSLAHARARVLLEAGQRDAALSVLKQALAAHPEDAFSALLFGALASAAEDVALAASTLQARSIGGLEADLVGRALATRRDPKLVKLSPQSGMPPLLPAEQLFQLATVLEGNGRPGLSAELLTAGTLKYPAEHKLWYPLLRVQVALRDYRGARATAEKMPSDIRFSPEALMLQAQVYNATGDRAAAIGAIQRAIRALPEDAKAKRSAAHLLLGQTFLDAGRPKEAKEAFANAERDGSSAAKALLGRASAELELGAFEAAEQAAAKAVQLEPLNDGARKLHVVALLEAQKYDAAVSSASNYVSQAPDRAEAWALRAKAHAELAKASARDAALRAQSLQSARTDLREALQRNPREPALLRSWLAVEEELSGYPASLKDVRAWLTEQRNWTGLVQVASYCNEKADAKTASELFREATAVAPNEPQVWRVYAVHLETTGATAEALAAQTQLLSLNGNDEAALRDVARLNRKLGDTEQAIGVYRRWLSVNPNALLALNNLAAILGSRPESVDEAVTLATRARELAPASAGVADTLGWLLFSRNQGQDRTQAVSLLTEASSGQDNPTHHFHLAEALAATGKPAEAKQAVALALKHAAFPERAQALALARQLGN